MNILKPLSELPGGKSWEIRQNRIAAQIEQLNKIINQAVELAGSDQTLDIVSTAIAAAAESVVDFVHPEIQFCKSCSIASSRISEFGECERCDRQSLSICEADEIALRNWRAS